MRVAHKADTVTSGLVKVGYYRETSIDAGWFYEINREDTIIERVSQLMADEYVKKISISKNYGV